MVQPTNYGAMMGDAFGSFLKARDAQQRHEQQKQVTELGALELQKLKQTPALQQQQQQQQLQRQQQAAQIFQSGDTDALASFMIENPDMQESILGAEKFASERSKQSKLEAARNMALGMDPNTELAKSAQVISEEGGDPSDTMSMMQQPDDVKVKAAETLWASLDPQGYKAFKSQQTEGMSEYERATIEAKKIDQQLRAKEAEIKREQNQLKRETDALKRQQLEQSIEQKKQDVQRSQVASEKAKEEEVASAVDAFLASTDTLKLIGKIETHPGLSDYVGVGGVSTLGGLIDPISGSEAAGVKSLIDTLGSQNFMNSIKQMQGMGALSDAEGKKVSASVSSLDPNMPEKDFNSTLSVIRNITKRGMNKQKALMKKKGVDIEEKAKEIASETPVVRTETDILSQYGVSL